MCWLRPIFPVRLQTSIFGTAKLNFRVRNGNGWTLCVKNTNFFLSVMLIENRIKVDDEEDTKLKYFNCKLQLRTNSSSPRSISIGQLNTLLCVHLRPIKLVVYE